MGVEMWANSFRWKFVEDHFEAKIKPASSNARHLQRLQSHSCQHDPVFELLASCLVWNCLLKRKITPFISEEPLFSPRMCEYASLYIYREKDTHTHTFIQSSADFVTNCCHETNFKINDMMVDDIVTLIVLTKNYFIWYNNLRIQPIFTL